MKKQIMTIIILSALLISGCGQTETIYPSSSKIPRPYIDDGNIITFVDNPSEDVYLKEIRYGSHVGIDRVLLTVTGNIALTIETKDSSRTVTASGLIELWARTRVGDDVQTTPTSKTIFFNCANDQFDKSSGFDYIRLIINGVVKEQYFITDF